MRLDLDQQLLLGNCTCLSVVMPGMFDRRMPDNWRLAIVEQFSVGNLSYCGAE